MSDVQSKIDFLLETEKLKSVLHKTQPHAMEQFENSAEHSWQTTLAALLFMLEGIDAFKVLKMLLIHNLVEIDASDVFVYDDQDREDIAEVEAKAIRHVAGTNLQPTSRPLAQVRSARNV